MKIVRFVIVVLVTGTGLGCNTATSPTAPSPTATPASVLYESQLYPGGSLSRTITVGATGTVSVTLTSLRPDPGVEVGLGVGIPRADGGGCHVSQSVATTTGSTPQLTIAADPGTYCVRVYDIGTLTIDVFFSITIAHP
jgi:hypothetical protein